MEPTSQTRLLDLLDHAYRVSDDLNAFDALLDNAATYFYAPGQSAKLADDLPLYSEADPHIDKHIARLERLISERSEDDKLGLSLERHAQFVLSAQGKVLQANQQADSLLPGITGHFVDNLPLSLDSVSALRDLIAELRAGVQSLERIVHLQIESNEPTPSFGFCSAVKLGDASNPSDEVGLRVSLSIFAWTDSIFESLRSALSLTESEGLVLKGVLTGLSQKEIAESRGRSVDTIKAQSKAILRKAGCSKMTELSHLCTSIAYVIGLSDMAQPSKDPGEYWVTPRQNMRSLAVDDGRSLAWYEYGAPNGRPILYCHGFFQGPFFLDTFKRGLLDANIRLICPSRPDFGYTSPPLRARFYEETAKNDALALIAALNLETLVIAAAHGGANHAFRLASELGDRVTGMALIGARPPITQEHIVQMPQRARTISAACRHAPSVARMIVTLGIKTYRKRGIRAFFEGEYAPSSVDRKDVDHPLRFQKMSEGMFHFIAQDGASFVNDGRAQMSDWTETFEAVTARQYWVHGRHCHVTAAHLLESFVRKHSNAPVDIIEDAGFNLLYQKPDAVLDVLKEVVGW